MSTLVRWNPVREMLNMRNALDWMFSEDYGFPAERWTEVQNWSLPLDVVENKDGYLIKASVPGVNPEDINITLEDNILTIRGELKKEEVTENARYHTRERRYGQFVRSVTLPTVVKADAIEADYHNGVLELIVPKAEEVKPRRIAIKTNGHNGKFIEANS